MPTHDPSSSGAPADLNAAVAAALARIPPLWPLRHFVAVNPFLGLADRPFATAAALLQRVVGAAPLPGIRFYREAWQGGLIEPVDLEAATGDGWTAAGLVAALDGPDESASLPIATVADLLDRERPGTHWARFVVDEISKWCAVQFDENQTTWNAPWKAEGLFAAWRAGARHDRNPESMGLSGFRGFVATLPSDPLDAIARCHECLAPAGEDPTDFFHRQLVTIAGWAGHAQYRAREDALRGRNNDLPRDLLAIRLAYDAALLQAFAADHDFVARWHQATRPAVDWRRLEALSRWQLAYESGYQRRLGRMLADQPSTVASARPPVQAAFCIDVRSEVLRRHLERTLPGARTLGFAGFFGFPVAHCDAPGEVPEARCPVLLVPPVQTAESHSPTELKRLGAKRAAAGAWKAFQNSATSCFSFVEAVGLGFGVALARRTGAGRLACSRVAPRFEETPLETRAGWALAALRNMSLVTGFARLVLLCGHGSDSANNPYASGLDCGACGGHAGDVNARLAVATLNDPAVRARLAQNGVALPSDTIFVAGLHNTTTDDVVLFDVEKVPDSHHDDVERLRAALARAGAGARRERAPTLALHGLADEQIDVAVRARATDISEVRPEWGLANNAAFVAAPRSRTAALTLDGRVFLHDYDASLDPDDKVLTMILCAPVVVGSWINLQYYASRVDPAHYGSGNKVLHNVVGGLGVVEGNGGDLKVGLPLQSIHDGTDFVHEPRRLSVYIDAEPARIRNVLQAHPEVRQLFDHEWLHLFALRGGDCHRYHRGQWLPLGESAPPEDEAGLQERRVAQLLPVALD